MSLITMPAGTYYVGDICYVMHDVWDEACDLMIPDGKSPVDGIFDLEDGRQFAVFSTAYGDGVYYDESARAYPVDSGCIGCIKVSDIKDETFDIKDIDNLGNIIHFDEEFEVGNYDGVIFFGNVNIWTTE